MNSHGRITGGRRAPADGDEWPTARRDEARAHTAVIRSEESGHAARFHADLVSDS